MKYITNQGNKYSKKSLLDIFLLHLTIVFALEIVYRYGGDKLDNICCARLFPTPSSVITCGQLASSHYGGIYHGNQQTV